MEANYFTILYWFCHTLTWICHGCTRVPHPEPPSHLPPGTIPLGHPSAPAPSILYPCDSLSLRYEMTMVKRQHLFNLTVGNMHNIIYETNCQPRFDAWYRMLGAGVLGCPRGMVWGGRWEGGSGLGTHVHPWQIHVDVWQNQYNIVK